MVFSSIVFIFQFLPVTVLVYYLLPDYMKNGWLVISSLFFYAWGEPRYVFWLICSTVMNYLFGRWLERGNKKILTFGILANAVLLCFFKYAAMMEEMLHALTGEKLDLLGVAMPIGISFYSFQSISYLEDVYRKDAMVQKNIVNFAAYITMFPQLIAGPVVQYRDIESQLSHPVREKWEQIGQISDGVQRFILGLCKKVIVADSFAGIVASVGERPEAMLTAWVGVFAFTMEIYFDFSGYSDMGIGLAKMLGFELKENFDYPYIAKNITQFWRRWHISIGTWFRTYVYIPLGGNRKGIARQIINIFIVWGLTGMWHGAGVNFILWGLYYGILLTAEKVLWIPLWGWIKRKNHKNVIRIMSALAHVYTMFFVMLGWCLFEIMDLKNLGRYVGSLFGIGVTMVDNTGLWLIQNNWLFICISILFTTPVIKKSCAKLEHSIMEKYPGNQAFNAGVIVLNLLVIFGMFALAVAYLIVQNYQPFLYFKF